MIKPFLESLGVKITKPNNRLTAFMPSLKSLNSGGFGDFD
jgi:hypothetical protein